ncbi:polysaccharide pyruvyl transferase family protein [Lacticaseibacillus parakribbianus]|uniref:polysaccharide pyruvyl transferase family protein n=1 Tax=Lacticaseibacillus parakribbianus TaxID=2970927 RepID=UPI0021CB1CF1|nr:polysaccharide pyruvyl transferase family protein [Lacticaseibacillus parakribbianus]
MSKLKKVYVNAYFRKNVGDDLFLYVLSSRYPSVNFVADVPKKYQETLTSISNLKMRNATKKTFIARKLLASIPWIPFVSGAMKYDAIIEIGGSIFMQAPGKPGISGLRNAFTRKSIPYFVIGSNFGPYEDNRFVSGYNVLFKKTGGVVFRDSYSAKLFDASYKISVAPDVVFGINPETLGFKLGGGTGLLIAVPVDLARKGESLADQRLASKYEKCMARLIAGHVRSGHRAVILCFCSDENDEEAANRIFEMLDKREKEFTSIVNYQSVDQIFSLFSNADYLLSSRYHSMILGWVFGVPQLVIPYSLKTEHVRAELWKSQYSLSPQNFIENIDSVDLRNFNTMDSKLVNVLRKKSSGQFKYTDRALNN